MNSILPHDFFTNFIYFFSVQPINLSTIPHTLEGVIKLAKEHGWQYVVEFTSKILLESPQLTDQERSHLSALRYEGLFRLKMYDEMSIEITQSFLDANLTLSDSFPVVESMHQLDLFVSLQLLTLEVKLMSGHGQDALESLNKQFNWLENRLKNVDGSDSSLRCRETYWKWHTNCHIINNYIRCRNWKSAIRAMRDLTVELKTLIDHSNEEKEKSDLVAAQIVLLCRSAKLLLQVKRF